MLFLEDYSTSDSSDIRFFCHPSSWHLQTFWLRNVGITGSLSYVKVSFWESVSLFLCSLTCNSHRRLRSLLGQFLFHVLLWSRTGVGTLCILRNLICWQPIILVSKKRPVAIAVISFGASIGGIIYPIMFRNLIVTTRYVFSQSANENSLTKPLSFKWTVRSIAFLNVLTFIVANLVRI